MSDPITAPGDATPILGLPRILPAQAQKHVTHNEGLRLLDVIVQLSVESRQTLAPPPGAAAGSRHIVAAGATGAFAGHDGKVAFREAASWAYLAPEPGWRAHVIDENVTVTFDGSNWRGPAEGPLRVAALGIATDPDAANVLAVAGPATLLTHAGAGHQLKINKATATDTASLLFQTGWSGRAEMGTAGSDAFAVKVSADGTAWVTGISIDPATGRMTAPAGARIAPGNAAAPGLGFDGDPDTGIFRPAADVLAFAAGGVERLRITAAGLLAGPAIAAPAEATAGKLMAVGHMGLGGGAIALTAADNLDTLTQTGFYANASAANASGNNYPIAATGLLYNLYSSANCHTQTFVAYATQATAAALRIFTRAQGAAGWTPWVEQVHRGNLVGAVIERGGNANGEYTRWADGTQICWHSMSSSNTADATWTHPAAFATPPMAVGTAVSATMVAVMLSPWPTATSAAFSVRDPAGARVACNMRLMAMGRWY